MRLLLFCLLLVFAGCKKDKFTSAPQIKFISVSPDVWGVHFGTDPTEPPKLTLSITDSEGDLGLKGTDTSWVYIRMTTDTRVDSFTLPTLGAFAGKNFDANVLVSLRNAIHNGCFGSPHVDSLYFEVYVTDFAKNKSNIITTDKPVYFVCP